MSYNFIVNPNTNRRVSIHSKLGKQIINIYTGGMDVNQNAVKTFNNNISDDDLRNIAIQILTVYELDTNPRDIRDSKTITEGYIDDVLNALIKIRNAGDNEVLDLFLFFKENLDNKPICDILNVPKSILDDTHIVHKTRLFIYVPYILSKYDDADELNDLVERVSDDYIYQ
jgi:hypothetical protein